MKSGGRNRRRGTILIVTMLIVFTLAALVVVMCGSMGVEASASANMAASLQASSIERGAEQYIMAILTGQKDSLSDLTEDYYAGIQVGDGYFWILRPDYGDDSQAVFGLNDENAKLNINLASVDSLMRLPNMTQDIAAAIIDWRDPDSTISASGAEDEYYGSLSPNPYRAKNADFETVEELLLVRNFTRELLYGNGTAGPLGTQNSSRTFGSQTTDLQTANGLYDLLTIYSAEPAGQKININDRNQRSQLQALLQKQLPDPKRADAIIAAMGRDPQYKDVFDFYFKVKLKSDELTAIYDSITTKDSAPAAPSGAATGTTAAAQQVKGRINVNKATRDVLLCLPGLESADVDALLAQRQGATPGDTSVAWVADALKEKAIGLSEKITGKSYQYSADILAVSGNGRAFKRCRIVVNASGQTPQIVYRRDLTDRGWPMDPQILASLRAGQGPGEWANVRSSAPGGMFR